MRRKNSYLSKVAHTFKEFLIDYFGYAALLLPFHPSAPSLTPFPLFWQTDQNRSGPDPGSFSSKSNYSSSLKHGERE